jgi:hypothetical protein
MKFLECFSDLLSCLRLASPFAGYRVFLVHSRFLFS